MTGPSPLDKAVGRTSAKETYTDETGDSPSHGGAFDKDLHETPKVLWLSVALMCMGTALIGGGVVALSMDTTTAIVLFIAGAALGVVGVVLGIANNIMSNVE